MAPAKQSHMSQPSTKMAATMQTTRIVMAIVYLSMRDLRSASGDWPRVVMLWAFSKVTFDSLLKKYRARARLLLV